jgi:hypothetical protein
VILCRVLACSALLLCLVATADGRQRYDPKLRFRTLVTPRFDIHFHQGEERLAQRLAEMAEGISADLEPRLGRPRARVHIVLVDQTDLANGWATPLPYNLIEIVAASPRHDSTIGNTNDWLEVVFRHEYAHVLHLERSRGFLGAVGRIFGRNPFFYPNLYTPPWQIEGLATYFESGAVPGVPYGRLHAGDFEMLMTRAARANHFIQLDRASNVLVQWPGGQTPYVYGAFFHKYLSDKYGEASLKQLADATAGRVPFLGSRAFKQVFGKPLGELWEEFDREVSRTSPSDANAARRLTHHGFNVNDPWFTSGGQIVYSVSTPHEFPALMSWDEGGITRVAKRVGGNQTTARGSQVFFDQVEYVRSVGLQSDLYVREGNGTVRRLTHGARAADPDVSPDGTRLVCVVQGPEGRALATLPVTGGVPVVLLSEPGVNYASPRWSPDGRQIVVERRTLYGLSVLAILDPASGSSVTSWGSVRGRNATPIWSPDGRKVYFASDRDGGPFRLFVYDLDDHSVHRLSSVESAQSPTLSPDGKTLVFVGYTPDGHDLFSIALADAVWETQERTVPGGSLDPAQWPIGSMRPPERTYSPFATLLPRFWTPVIEDDGDDLAVGGATAGADALGRHAYYASAAWSARGRPDWVAGYAYNRWRPTLFVDASDDQDPFREGDIRVREVNAGALMSFRTVRRTQTIAGTYHAAHERIDCAPCDEPFSGVADRRAVRGGWLFDTSRSFGYSISDEEGVNVSLSAEWTGEPLGADGDATALVGDVRGYLRAGPRHAVIAGRVAAAHSSGDELVTRVFGAGGSSAGLPLLDFDFGAIGLVRGFDSSDVSGRSAVVANLDYRLPLAWIERGSGTWPFFLRSLHGALFADVGSAWDRHRTSDDVRASFGAELSADVVVGFSLPMTISGGIAFRHDPTRRSDGPTFFARLGRAF